MLKRLAPVEPKRPARIHPAFRDAHSKVFWAKDKIDQLEFVARGYAQNGVRTFIEHADGEPYLLHVLTDQLQFPVHLQVGDIVRNLRGSLDHAVAALYRAHNKRDDSSMVKWYTGTDRQSLESALNGALVKHGFGELKSFFLDEMEHTEAKGSPIYQLNKIDRANKHRQLNVVVVVASAPIPDFAFGDGGLMQGSQIIQGPGQHGTFEFPQRTFIFDQRTAPFSSKLTFGPSEVFANSDVIPTLKNLASLVPKCLIEFQQACLKCYPDKFASDA